MEDNHIYLICKFFFDDQVTICKWIWEYQKITVNVGSLQPRIPKLHCNIYNILKWDLQIYVLSLLMKVAITYNHSFIIITGKPDVII